MTEAAKYFLSESINLARTLPHQDCLRYLVGLLEVGGEAESLQALRHLVISMNENDQQLELIASGQMKFTL